MKHEAAHTEGTPSAPDQRKSAATGILRDKGVRTWRAQQLIAAGYPQDAASELCGNPDVDLHVAIDLLRHGCSVETALRILR